MTFRMRPASKTCRRPAAIRRVRPQNNQRACLPHVPADILSGGRARRSSSGRNTQRIEAKEKRCGDVLSAVNEQIQFFRAKLFTSSQVATGASDFDK
jgi:hypothetical protein